MSYRDCLPCRENGTKPKRGWGERLVFDPRLIMPEPPTIEGHGLGAELVARRVYALGVNEQIDDYELTREQLLIACWWAGLYGPRSLRRVFGEWAQTAGRHLWYGCIQIPDPPRRVARAEAAAKAMGVGVAP